MELAVFVESMVRGFARYHKYALGADLRHLSRRLVALVIKANSRRDKTAILTELRDSSEEMKVLIVLAKEVKAFTNFKEFQQASMLAVDISRQSEGWLKSQSGRGVSGSGSHAPHGSPSVPAPQA